MTEQSDNNDKNPLKDVQNILGFLLAGFAGILGFLGLRSGEVSAVLRNPSTEASASFIVLILFLAVIAAISSVVVSREKAILVPWVIPIVLALLGILSIMVYATPVNESYGSYGLISLSIGFVLTIIACYAFVIVHFELKDKNPSHSLSETKNSIVFLVRHSIFSARLNGREIQAQRLWILASVTLLAVSIYGAMRVEASSQRMGSVQISASLSKEVAKASKATLSAHVTGSKLQNVRYVAVTILGVPKEADIISFCSVHEPNDYTQCVYSPCRYLPRTCQLIYGAVVPADANGKLNYALSDKLVPSNYQDISVKAAICERGIGCAPDTGPLSQLDVHLSKLPAAEPPK